MEGGGGGDQEKKKHTCKVCKRRFPCGRSLGGHMRSHISDEKVSQSIAKTFLVGSGRGPGYGLRENPKKTWRLGDHVSVKDEKMKLCRVCGKGFLSWKALFGHMRCHSGRSSSSSAASSSSSYSKHILERREKGQEEEEDGSWAHMPAIDEVAGVVVPRKKRARRTAVIEMERELEEIALCLMMLSRDVGFWGEGESSDKNSVVLEEKVVSEDLISDRDGKGKEGSELVGVIEHGSLSNGLKRVESDVSDDGFGLICREDGEFKKPKVCASDAEVGEEIDRELRKDSPGKIKLKISVASELGKGTSLVPSKRARTDAYEAKLSRDCSRIVSHEACNGDLGMDSDKKMGYECATCNKIFHSYQALGGHRSSHKRINGCSMSKKDGIENSIEREISENDWAMTGQTAGDELEKKAKVHQCPICLKIFSSGQALGGHKRSHLAMNSDNVGCSTSNQAIVIQKQLPNLLDLNLPAPADEDTSIINGNVDSESWWVGSNHKHEPPVDLISN